MKRWVFGLGLSLLVISGCSSGSSASNAQQNVAQYNQLVDSTLNGYAASKAYAETQNQQLKDYLLHGSDFETPVKLPNLSAAEKEAFKLNTVVMDDYFTSLGSEGVREVLVVKGVGARMFVTATWGKGKLLDLDRKVFKDE